MRYIVEYKGRRSSEWSKVEEAGDFATREEAERSWYARNLGCDGGAVRVVPVIPEPDADELAWEREESRRDKAGDFDTVEVSP